MDGWMDEGEVCFLEEGEEVEEVGGFGGWFGYGWMDGWMLDIVVRGKGD